jgi:hypothetical protein
MPRFRPIVAYFDTNVFHEIVNRDSDDAGIQKRLAGCTRCGELVLPTSLIVMNEIVDGIGSGVECTAKRSIRQLHTQWRLGDWEMLIKPLDRLASGEISAFARGEASPSPFFMSAERQVFIGRMTAAFGGIDRKSPQQLGAEFSSIVGDNREQ